MASRSSYFDAVLGHSSRDQLMQECPALQLLCYQHVMAALMTSDGPLDDPLRRRRGSDALDGVGEMLAVSSVSELMARVFSETVKDEARSPSASAFWASLRTTLEVAWTPVLPTDSATQRRVAEVLASVKGVPHFIFPGNGPPGLPLMSGSLRNVVESSKRFLRSVSTCALSASTASLKDKNQHALASIVQLAQLVPRGDAEGQVTSEGLNFCMMALQQQWWVLVAGALDRILALTQHEQSDRIPLPQLWQLLAILVVLDTSAYMYAFPNKDADPVGYQLVARLSEIGLTYLLKTNDGVLCFAVSPHLHHALEWQATTPVCATSMLGGGSGDNSGSYRREDTDTIITETNFRLYAYTRSEDLLNILEQFAVREECVGDVLVCFRLTRDSFVAALRKGISAAQILRFLSLRAHPSMLRKYGEDAHAGASLSTTSTGTSMGASNGVLSATSAVPTNALAIPQSVCDQLFMWESECNRVVFTKHVVMLRNMTSEQQQAIAGLLQELGAAEALVYQEPGYMVVREDVYDRFLAGVVAEDAPA